MAASVFADTSALLALGSRNDQYHAAAAAISHRHLASGGRMVSTALVLAELQAHLLYRRGPVDARRIVGALLDDPAHEWVDVTIPLVRASQSAWLERFADQRLTMTDAVSFEVMRRQRIKKAFAFDDDFVTAGFQLLR